MFTANVMPHSPSTCVSWPLEQTKQLWKEPVNQNVKYILRRLGGQKLDNTFIFKLIHIVLLQLTLTIHFSPLEMKRREYSQFL